MNKKKNIVNKTPQISTIRQKEKKKKCQALPRFQAFYLTSLNPASFIALQYTQWLMQKELLSGTAHIKSISSTKDFGFCIIASLT